MTEHFPKAESADICLLLEGTFPFVLGGVSSWVYQLIESFPNYRFAAIFLGGRAEDYSGLRYPLPKNLVHLDVHYLFTQEQLPEPQAISCEQSVINHMETLHDQFRSQQPKNIDFEKITNHLQEYLITENKLDEKKFLYSKESWNYILNGYNKYCPEEFIY